MAQDAPDRLNRQDLDDEPDPDRTANSVPPPEPIARGTRLGVQASLRRSRSAHR